VRPTGQTGTKVGLSDPPMRNGCARSLTDKSYPGDNRVVAPESSYRRRGSLPQRDIRGPSVVTLKCCCLIFPRNLNETPTHNGETLLFFGKPSGYTEIKGQYRGKFIGNSATSNFRLHPG